MNAPNINRLVPPAPVSPDELLEQLSAWLDAYDCGQGIIFYSPSAWEVTRRETVGVGAVLHVVIESSRLFQVLNGYTADGEDLRGRLTGFLATLGYTWRPGHDWSLHVYPLSHRG